MNPSIFFYLNDSLLRVAVELWEGLESDESFWKSKISQKIRKILPRGAKPEYKTYCQQYWCIVDLEGSKPEDKLLILDLGDQTLSWLFKNTNFNSTFLFHTPEIIFIMARCHPSVMRRALDSYRYLFPLQAIYDNYNPTRYELCQFPRLENLKVLRRIIGKGPNWQEFSEEIAKLPWSLKELSQIKYILNNAIFRGRIRFLGKFIKYITPS